MHRLTTYFVNSFSILLITFICGTETYGQEDLYKHSMSLYQEALSIEGDFQRKVELAQEASKGFKSLGIDSSYLDSELIIARAALITKDSSLLFEHLMPVLDIARTAQDTGVLVAAYNLLAFYYFSVGDTQKGTATLKVPHQNQYYSVDALEGSITNLGALIDVGITYTMNLDTVYEYVNQLQVLADKYDDPSVQVVSRFKLAFLFSKADNYKDAIDVLKEAAPYIGNVENKGFLHYYYENMIKGYINLNQPDSAIYYIGVLQEVASYEPDDPRNCYILISKIQCDLLLGILTEVPEGFDKCYERATSNLEKSKRVSVSTLNTIYVKCQYLYQVRQWKELDLLLKKLIAGASSSKSNAMLRKAYELQYQAYRDQGLTQKALNAHVEYAKYAEEMNQYVFTQSEAVIRNQMNLKLAENENNLLQIENQNQQLRIERGKADRRFYISGFVILSLILAYFYNLATSRAKRSRELSDLVDKRTKELKQSNDALLSTNQKLSKSYVELERYTYMASHDLKTPLYNVIKLTRLVKEKLKATADKDVQQYLSIIEDGGKQMDTLIGDVLDYSRLSNNKNQEELSIDLNGLIYEVTTSMAEFVKEKNAQVEVPKRLSTIVANRDNLFILFKNLIDNGIKYNESSSPTVKIYEKASGEHYIICIEDNGIGIKPEYRREIFKMFSRLHTHEDYEGSGIGLASCKKIVEDLGGSIHVDNNQDNHTVFEICLPMALIIKESNE